MSAAVTPPERGREWWMLAGLALAGVLIYWPIFSVPPFDEDNLYALAWVDAVPARAVVAGDAVIYPEWRPLAYLSIWVEHRIVQLRWPGAHHAVNLAIWVLCAWLVFRGVRRLSGSWWGGLAAAATLLTDPRATWALVSIIDRQATFACAFGLAALLMATSAPVSRGRAAAMCALLCLAALSKEYGLSFALAIAGYAAVSRRADLGRPAALACLAYGLLRLGAAGGAATPYCEEMYFFFDLRDRCIEPWQVASLPQMAYNVTATLINLPLLGLMSPEGRPMLAEYRLVAGVAGLTLAVIALRKGPGVLLAVALVPVANALLSFMIYRDRNQLAGACALALLAGIGLARAWRMAVPPFLRAAIVALVLAVIATQAVLARMLVAEQRAVQAAIEPCASEIRDRPFGPAFIARVKIRFGLPDAHCQDRQY